MAFPFIWHENFESGATIATATSGTLIDVAHYTDLARYGMAPYRGAYCGRIKLAGGTTSQYWREDTAFDDLDASGGLVRYVAFAFYLGKDFAMADTNRFSLMELESTLNTTSEVSVGLIRSGDDIQFWHAETGAAAITTNTKAIGTTETALGKWYWAEVAIVFDDAANNNGTINTFIDGGAAGAQVGTLDQADIVDAKFGVMSPDAGTSGTVLIDSITYDETDRIYPPNPRYRASNARVHGASDHPILGPGRFSAAVTGTGTDAVLSLYDSDAVPLNLEPIAVLRNVSANEFIPGHDIFEVHKGLYTVMSGTAVQAFISIDRGGLVSDGAVISHGLMQGAPRR